MARVTHMNGTQLPTSQQNKVYSIRAELDNDIFTVSAVDDQSPPNRFIQAFTQNNFPNHELFHVAQTVVNAIKNSVQSEPNPNEPTITCIECGGYACLTVLGAEIHTLALPPDPKQKTKAKSPAEIMTEIKNKHRNKMQPQIESCFPAYVVFQKMVGNKMYPELIGMWCYVGVPCMVLFD